MEGQQDESTSLAHLNPDALLHCIKDLSLRDTTNLALTCLNLKQMIYHDLIWDIQAKKYWPFLRRERKWFEDGKCRDCFIDRYLLCHRFQFFDPSSMYWRLPNNNSNPINQILWIEHGLREFIACVQNSALILLKFSSNSKENPDSLDPYQTSRHSSFQTKLENLSYVWSYPDEHKGKITCVRSFSSENFITGKHHDREISNFVLVTSSMDHTVKMWGKTKCFRTLKGHSKPVICICDKLLNRPNQPSPVLATGSSDCTIRLWPLMKSNCNKSQRLVGHEDSINCLTLSNYDPSLLVSASRDCKLKIWDCASSSNTIFPLSSLKLSHSTSALHCHANTCQAVCGPKVILVDLRIMRQVAVVSEHKSNIISFSPSPFHDFVCTSSTKGPPLVWDMRKSTVNDSPKPISALESQKQIAHHLHVDSHKIVCASFYEPTIKVWDSGTFEEVANLDTPDLVGDSDRNVTGISSMACKKESLAFSTLPYDSSVRALEFNGSVMENVGRGAVEQGPSKSFSKFWDL